MENLALAKEIAEVCSNTNADILKVMPLTYNAIRRTLYYKIYLIQGPVTYKIDGQITVVGVVSWGWGCGNAGKPGVYARVTSAMAFINKELTKTCSGKAESPKTCGRRL